MLSRGPQMTNDFEGENRQTETGFGTGLRAHLGYDHAPAEAEPSVAAPNDERVEARPARPRVSETELGQRTWMLDALEAELAERERILAQQSAVLAEQERALAEQARMVAEQQAQLEQVRDAASSDEGRRSVREVLRTRAEQHLERLWRSFEEALEATRADGRPDFEVRLSAARVLLDAASSEPSAGHEASEQISDDVRPDELARRRLRRIDDLPSL